MDGRRRRLPREERERHIIDEAIRFFAEVGFEGQTRALAERLGVTQPLLYRYFPDKEALIERVFEEVHLKRWRPEWGALLRDRSRSLEHRLAEFYVHYCQTIFHRDWVRIFMFAGLKGESMNQRYFEIVHTQVLAPICGELRHEMGLPGPETLPIDDLEINLAWAVHGAVFYIAMRKWIYKLPVPDDMSLLIANIIQAYLNGSGPTIKHLVADRMAASG
jgi:AcrR family transcriptional regulator